MHYGNKHHEGCKKTSLKDRVKQLDKSETFEEKAQKYIEKYCKHTIKTIEDAVKLRKYNIVDGVKTINIKGVDIHYSDNETFFSDTPRGDGDGGIWVNNKQEADYLINAMKNRLEQEDIMCTVEIQSHKYQKKNWFLELLAPSSKSYKVNIHYTFKW